MHRRFLPEDPRSDLFFHGFVPLPDAPPPIFGFVPGSTGPTGPTGPTGARGPTGPTG